MKTGQRVKLKGKIVSAYPDMKDKIYIIHNPNWSKESKDSTFDIIVIEENDKQEMHIPVKLSEIDFI